MNNHWSGSQSGSTIVITSRNQTGGCTWCTVHDLVIRFNKIFDTGRGFVLGGADNVQPSEDSHNIWIHDNLFYSLGIDPLDGTADGGLTNASTASASHARITHNTWSKTLRFGIFNVQPACSFDVNFYEISNNLFDVNSNTILGDTVGGGYPALNACFDSNSIFLNNAVVNINVTETCNGSGNQLNDYPSDFICLSGSSAVQFADRTNDNYTLQATSPLKGAGSDGKDVGADINELNNKIRGVVP